MKESIEDETRLLRNSINSSTNGSTASAKGNRLDIQIFEKIPLIGLQKK